MLKRLVSMSIIVLLIAMACIPASALSSYSLTFNLTSNTILTSQHVQGSGTLLDSSGQPVGGHIVNILLRNMSDDIITNAYATTDAAGKFTANLALPLAVKPGNYVLQLTAQQQGISIKKNIVIEGLETTPATPPPAAPPVVPVIPTTPGSTPDEQKTTDSGVLTIHNDADGKSQAVVEVNSDKIKNQVADTKSLNVIIEATVSGEKVNSSKVKMTGQDAEAIAQGKKGAVIEANDATIDIPADTMKQIGDKAGSDQIVIAIEEDANASNTVPTNQAMLSQAVDLTILVNNEKVTNFNQAITVTIPVDKNKIQNPNKVIAYYYNESKGAWEAVGGIYDPEKGVLIFTTMHFSKFAVMELNKTFNDITGSWAKDNIEVLAARNIMNGKGSGDMFEPKSDITRAEFAAIIARALNLPTVTPTGMFKDVPAGAWYAGVVEAAAKAGIVKGNGENFNPNAKITREQIATMLVRALELKQGTITNVPQATFGDASDVSSYAKDAVAIAANKGIVKGSDNKFSPKKNATREEAATMMYRFLQAVGEIK